MNLNYLLLNPKMTDIKPWYEHKHPELLLTQLKLSFLSFCLAERLQEPYFDTKKHGGFDPHRALKEQTPPNYMKAIIHTNLPPGRIEAELSFCRDYYEVRYLTLRPTLHEIFEFKINWLLSLTQTQERVFFLDLDVVVRKSFKNLIGENRIYFYSDEGQNIVKNNEPTIILKNLCKNNGLTLDISMWNTGFLSIPKVAFENWVLSHDLYKNFLDSGMISPMAEQATIGLLLNNYALKNNFEVKETLEYFDHYWYYGKTKYRDFII